MRLIAATAAIAILWAPTAGASTLFGLVDTGELFASGDAGVTWSVQSTLPVSNAVAIAAGETSVELFLATETGLVFRSTDAGLSWTISGTVATPDVVDMVIRTNGDVFLLTRTGIVFRSSDDGVTFTSIATLTASNHVSIDGDEGGGNLYALTRTGEVARSADGGTTWNTVGAVTTSDAVAIQTHGLDLFVLTGAGNIASSTDQGITWTIVGTISQVHMSDLTIDGGQLIACSAEGLISRSSNGTTWGWVGSINQLRVVALGDDVPSATGILPDGPHPNRFALYQNAPNPFNPGTEIRYDIPPGAGVVTLRVYNVRGRLVRTLVNEPVTAGVKTTPWNGLDDRGQRVASGVYFYRLQASEFVRTRKMIFLK